MSGITCEKSECQVMGFEGAEKKIEVNFREEHGNPNGLRSILVSQWQTLVLDPVHCFIMSTCKNEFFDAHVLSESSLFVFPYKVILKTCGTTTLLCCIRPLLELAKNQCGLFPRFVFFSRKNFKYPELQLSPHTSLMEEMSMLKTFFPCGNMYTFGPTLGEHWVVFLADLCPRTNESISSQPPNKTLEILMEDLDPVVMKQFHLNYMDNVSASEITKISGIAHLLSGATTDETQFDPCGFSVNGLLDRSYFTIHVTPEPEFSYVSLETNVDHNDYTLFITSALNVFKPGKFIVTLLTCGNHDRNPKYGNPDGYLLRSTSGFDVSFIERLGYKVGQLSHSSWNDCHSSLLYSSFKSIQLPEAVTSKSTNIGAGQIPSPIHSS